MCSCCDNKSDLTLLDNVMDKYASVPGSHRLMELADCIEEIKTMCDCGAKATVNARINDGYIVTEGAQVVLGGNDSYIAMCHRCYIKGIREHKKIKLHGQN